MALSGGAKRSIGILCNKICYGHQGFATKGSCSPSIVDEVQSTFSLTGFFVRRYSAPSSSSDQISLIKQLRERTSAPMKDVKSALVDCNWDIDAAQKELRRRGIYLASKKSSRTASEGLLALAQNDTKTAIIELNCETDFVARNDIFQYMALSLAKLALSAESSQQVSEAFPVTPEYLESLKLDLAHPKLNGAKSVQEAVTELAAMMGENVKLRRGFAMSKTSPGVISTYLHSCPQPGVGRMAGILSLQVEDPNVDLAALQRVGSEIAMHVVAAKPLFVSKELVSSDALDNEREILRSQAEASGKPKMAIEKMVEGRMRKYFEEVVLMEQKYIVDDTIHVKTVLDNLSKEVGSPVKIESFFRMEVGEGIERSEADESEPAAQAV
ncbi:Elongation factor Ts mitochondrial [Bienertia sinuspersici]